MEAVSPFKTSLMWGRFMYEQLKTLKRRNLPKESATVETSSMKQPTLKWGPTSVYSGAPLFQLPEMTSSPARIHSFPSSHDPSPWNHSEPTSVGQCHTSTPTPRNEDTSDGAVVTHLFQPPEMRTPLYTVELIYSNPLKWGHLCTQWNSSIPTPWNEDTSVHSGTPLFQPPEMRTPLYTVELIYSNPLKWGHLCIQWNSSIPTPWNEDTSVHSGTPLFQLPEMRTPLYTVELLYSNPLKWGHILYTVEILYSKISLFKSLNVKISK